jgi:hypothetical protein
VQTENEKAVRDPMREAFEQALAKRPDARFWNTTDAMFWAWQAALQSQVSNTDVLEKIVKVADEQPFCSIGHIVEHVVPEIRDALATPAEKREQINALRQKIIDAEKALSGDTIQIPLAEYEKLKADAERWRKCKTMNKQWWLDAMAEAAIKGGRSLDEAIDAAIVRRVLDEKGE